MDNSTEHTHEHSHSTAKCAGCNCEAGACNCGACSMINKLPPKMAFWAGVVVTAGCAFALGFIVLLVMMFKGISVSSDATPTVKANTNTNTVAAAVANTNQKAAPSGKIDVASLKNVEGTGDYTIVEYSDTECPFCKRFQTTMLQVMDQYNGKVKWSYKYFPLNTLHKKANKEANAVACAGDQGKFWEYEKAIFAKTTSNDGLDDAEIYNLADGLGIDRTAFDKCITDGKFQSEIDGNATEAQSLGATGAPFSVVIDKTGNVVDVISGALPIDQVKTILDKYVK